MTEEMHERCKQKARDFAKNATNVLKQNPGLLEEIARYRRFEMTMNRIRNANKRESS